MGMAAFRLALVVCFVLATATVGLGEDAKKDAKKDDKDKGSKIDKDKLIGTWTFVKTTSRDGPPPEVTMKVEFSKDGKMTVHMTHGEKKAKMDGTWSLKGDRLTTVQNSPKGEKKKETVTVKELTGKKFVIEGSEKGGK